MALVAEAIKETAENLLRHYDPTINEPMCVFSETIDLRVHHDMRVFREYVRQCAAAGWTVFFSPNLIDGMASPHVVATSAKEKANG
jgi:hypothetical protein